jgi:LmbE family N-acetylglucosaminyl deacetylase
VPLTKQSIDALDAVIKAVRPSLVFAPWGDDTHQDHRNTSAQVRSATRYTQNVLFYEVPSTIEFQPDVYVDITRDMAGKVWALKAHKSQVHKVNVADLSIIDCARSMAHFRGYQGRVEAAEGFKALRLRLSF